MWLIPTHLQMSCALIAGSFAVLSDYMFGSGIEKTMPFLIFFIVIDYVTGSIAAIKKKEVSSNVGFYGLMKKLLLFILVIIGHGLDQISIEMFHIETAHWVRDFFVVGIVAMEMISITENLVRLNVPLPDKVKDLLALYHTSKKHKIPDQTKSLDSDTQESEAQPEPKEQEPKEVQHSDEKSESGT